ncbi:phosphotransferase family protein [Streptomyces fuscichromogenes]|uniref:phosphotransferase family protein n=1 Tax=Streptomyces fuscichromogenes TaxID=1324013 RepID=UPI00381EBF8D
MSIPAATATDLHGTVRITTDEERAAVLAVFERHGTPLPEGAVSVVFAYPGHGVGERHSHLSGCTSQMLLLSAASGQLSRLGVTVAAASTEPPEKHAHLGALSRSVARFTADDAALVPHTDVDEGRFLLRWTMVLGGSRDGLLVTGITDSVAHTRAVIDRLTADRLRDWAEAAGTGTGAATSGVTATYANGADSLGIVAFEAGVPLVAKVGPRAVIDAETAFVAEVNTGLMAQGHPPLFPVLHGVHHEGAQATSLMEQVEPLTLDNVVFADKAKFVLADEALPALEPHLRLLRVLYTSTARAQRPTVADYLFRERFHAVVEHEGFVATFRSFFPGWDPGTVLGADVVLPTGGRLSGYTPMTRWLDEASAALLPDSGCLVHGDVHLKNMLRRGDGSPVFVDPRTVWDGRDRPDIGFGDPSYDFATLLHSALPMSGLLQAVADGTSEALLPELPAAPDGTLDLSGLTAPFTVDGNLARFEERLLAGLGPDTEPRVLRARLYVGAANALAGWLKYERALATPQTWLAVYAYVLWYLDRARTELA